MKSTIRYIIIIVSIITILALIGALINFYVNAWYLLGGAR